MCKKYHSGWAGCAGVWKRCQSGGDIAQGVQHGLERVCRGMSESMKQMWQRRHGKSRG